MVDKMLDIRSVSMTDQGVGLSCLACYKQVLDYADLVVDPVGDTQQERKKDRSFSGGMMLASLKTAQCLAAQLPIDTADLHPFILNLVDGVDKIKGDVKTRLDQLEEDGWIQQG